jgi:hypothetical protein
MRTQSAKAKGRRLQQEVASRIRAAFSLPEADVRSTSMGAQGEDVTLSYAARGVFPFAIECKNTESINIWKAFLQSEEHAAMTGLKPLVVFSRNRSEVLCTLKFDDLLELLK